MKVERENYSSQRSALHPPRGVKVVLMAEGPDGLLETEHTCELVPGFWFLGQGGRSGLTLCSVLSGLVSPFAGTTGSDALKAWTPSFLYLTFLPK